jgi:SPP1 gp7 family putative phage head morphogenesis protein
MDEKDEMLFLDSVYDGHFFVRNGSANLPKLVFKFNEKELVYSFFSGLGGAAKGVNTAKFLENISYFCMAKTCEEVVELQKLTKMSKPDFIAAGKKINRTYSEQYLSSEYDTANIIGENVKLWEKTVKSDNTLLKYITRDDSKVREDHKVLDGIVRRAGDQFWDFNTPPNGDRCRCTFKVVEGEETNLKMHVREFNKKNDTDFTGVYNNDVRFDFNPAKKQIVFSEESSYFNTWKQYNLDFKKNNGGLN